jgi:hypothetical protein
MSVRFLALVCSAFLLFISSAFAQSVPRVDVSPVSYPVSTIRNVSTLGAYSVGPSDVPKHAFAHAIGWWTRRRRRRFVCRTVGVCL